MALAGLQKYHEIAGGPEHGGSLHWPGTPDGFPVRGESVPLMRDQEAAALPVVMDYHAQMFRTWVADEYRQFLEVMDRCSNSWYGLRKRIDRWDEQHNGLHIWLEWVQVYNEVPHAKHPSEAAQTR